MTQRVDDYSEYKFHIELILCKIFLNKNKMLVVRFSEMWN